MKGAKLALILAGLAALGPFSIDTYFPSFGAISQNFGVSSLQVQGTLTYYLLALAVTMLFHGALAAHQLCAVSRVRQDRHLLQSRYALWLVCFVCRRADWTHRHGDFPGRQTWAQVL